MRAAVSITAGLVLRPRLARPPAAVAASGVPAQAPTPALDVESFSRKSLDALLAARALVRRRGTSGDAPAPLPRPGAPGAPTLATARQHDPQPFPISTRALPA